MHRHHHVVLWGTAALACVAVFLWKDEITEIVESIAADPANLVAEPVTSPPTTPKRNRVATYDNGRTMIAPKISDAAIARRRMS